MHDGGGGGADLQKALPSLLARALRPGRCIFGGKSRTPVRKVSLQFRSEQKVSGFKWRKRKYLKLLPICDFLLGSSAANLFSDAIAFVGPCVARRRLQQRKIVPRPTLPSGELCEQRFFNSGRSGRMVAAFQEPQSSGEFFV